MWKLIENIEMISALKEGQVIATVEDDRFEKFRIKNIHRDGYFSVLHADGKAEAKVMPADNLLLRWWIEDGPP